jgi:hypothetical protein
LLIAAFDEHEGWRLTHIEGLDMYAEGYASSDSVSVVAVLDMDSNGYPEVVVRSSAGADWDDYVLEMDLAWSARWRTSAVSVGGSTI